MKLLSFLLMFFSAGWMMAQPQSAFTYSGKGIVYVKDANGRVIAGKELKQKLESGEYTLVPVMKDSVKLKHFLIRPFEAGEPRVQKVNITDVYQLSDTLVTGGDLPAFSLNDLTGKNWTNDSLKGKVTILHFWKMYNQQCDEEINALNRVYKKYIKNNPAAKIQIAGITKDKAASVKGYKREMIIEYPLLSDAEPMMSKLGLAFVPTTIVMDQNGKIYNLIPGALKAYMGLLERDLESLGVVTGDLLNLKNGQATEPGGNSMFR